MNGQLAGLPPTVFAAYAGRNQGPELFHTTPFVPTSTIVVPKTLSMNRPLDALIFRFRGRVAIAGANYAAVAAEAPQTILNRIRVRGTYKGAALTPIDLSGATAFATLPRIYYRQGSSCMINGVRQADPGIPFGQAAANFGNIGTYDLDIFYFIPMWPIVAPANRSFDCIPYCWQPRDWNDTLEVQIDTGDGTSFGTLGGGGTTTFTAFGSGAGAPQIQIYTRYLSLGPLRSGFSSACVVRGENPITGGIAGVANSVRLSILQKQKTTAILTKTGVILTGTSAGVTVFASLSDALTDNTQPRVDNRNLRENQSDRTFKEHMMLQDNTVIPEGYQLFSFIDTQHSRSALRADLATVVAPGAEFALYSDIIAANANNRINVLQEQIYADANDPMWAATR